MGKKRSDICKLLLDNPEAVYPPASYETIVLEERQFYELEKLRNDIRKLCETGEDQAAERIAEMAQKIIIEGPPIRE